MAEFKNTMGIGEIVFTMRTNNYCPLGNDYYTNNFTVRFLPNERIPDYVVVQEAINQKANWSELTLEDSVEIVYDILAEYEPLELSVSSYSDDATHFPVEVTKKSQ